MTATKHSDSALDALWMPFTANRSFKQAPRMLVAAQGMFYTADDGREILDGTSGLWCVNAGHGRTSISNAIAQQARTMDYAPGFQMGHPISFEFAQRLSEFAPGNLDHIFFTNSGSEAVDTALKMALAYHRARGDTSRHLFIGRERAYHGVGFGGISVGGIETNRRAFAAQLLPHTAHIRHTHDLQRNAFSHGQPSHGVEFADDLERVIAEHGTENVAAVIVEPVAGSTGVLLPPVGYLDRIREICDRHNVLLIFDEVITGFGRLGAAFGANRFGVMPDMMTVAKGLTNGTVPMGAVFAHQRIHDAVIDASAQGIEFFHGYTYSGHPLACAAGMATLDIYESESLFERAASMESYWEDAVHSLRGLPHVIDVRNIGLVAAIELSSLEDAPGSRGFQVFTKAFEMGVLIRVTADIIALSPPLIAERVHVDQLVDVVRRTILRVT